MKREKVTKFNKFYDVPTHIFIESLIPNYAKHLIDLINILCIDSSSAINISRMVDIITFEIILNNNRSHKFIRDRSWKINVG